MGESFLVEREVGRVKMTLEVPCFTFMHIGLSRYYVTYCTVAESQDPDTH